jgi:hypothetical protein
MSDSNDSKETPNLGPDPTEKAGAPGWLDALNSFLDRVYLQADRDTGC